MESLAKTGVDYFEGTIHPNWDPEAKTIDIVSVYADAPLPLPVMNCFVPGDLKCFGMEDAVLEYAADVLEQAARLGVQGIVFGSGGSRSRPDDLPLDEADDRFVELLKRMMPLFAENRIDMLLEPLAARYCNYINTLAESVAIVKRVGHPRAGVIVDTDHIEREEFYRLAEFRPHIWHAHICEPYTRLVPHSEYMAEAIQILDNEERITRASLEPDWEGDPVGGSEQGVAFFHEALS
jgi:sugar phosphate isomerase/epimerase